MKTIGLTGSIATGKSSISKMFCRLRIPVHDSDKTVHTLMSPNGAAVPKIIKLFGDVRDNNNGIDRQKLGNIIFSDIEAKNTLEALIHPLVHLDRSIFIKQMRGQRRKVIVVDIPLLFETQSDHICDMIICAWAPEFLQRKRALKRFGMSEKKLSSIINQQMSQREKMKLADFCLPTGLGKAYSFKLLKRWLSIQ